MSVSHTAVSWIQVIGLIVGLYGFFFVSVSIFGDKNAHWFSALLPASGTGLGVLVTVSVLPISPVVYTLAALLAFAVFYFTSAHIHAEEDIVIAYKDDPWGPMRALPKLLLVMTVIITIPTLALFVWAGITHANVTSTSPANPDPYNMHLLGGGVLSLWGFVFVYSLPRSLRLPQLLKLGFVLSVLAILTQFIPPVLDLLNIPITKP